MMREWPYTASNRDVLGCTSPPTSRFPSALEMSLGLRPRDISRASGNLLVVGDVQPNTSLLSAVYVYNISFWICFPLVMDPDLSDILSILVASVIDCEKEAIGLVKLAH